MATASPAQMSGKTLQDPELKQHLQRLRRTDNLTNWWYLVRTYLFLTLMIGGAFSFDLWRQEQGITWLASLPVFILAIVCIGAGQHQLSGLAHEGVHHILFQNRLLNEFVSDWFCLFPLFSSTHHYRLQHLAHHQFVNDPDRDPDVSQLKTSGHWLSFPIDRAGFLRSMYRQLLLLPLARFILVRAKYNATGTDKNPYLKKGVKLSKTGVRVGLLYLVSLFASLTWGVVADNAWILSVIPCVLFVLATGVFLLLPETAFHQSRLHPVISLRKMTLLRITYITILFMSLAWFTHLTGIPAWAYYLLLWVVPIFTSFSFFMILRQWVQHGNGDRGWLTNTRIFYVDSLLNFAVFPMGQDFHLPHHVYATVPHYRLKELHEILLDYSEYREQAVEVHGYFHSPERPKVHPTVIDVLGPDYSGHHHPIHLDHTVLDDCEVDEKDSIVSDGERAAATIISQQSATAS
ncbi:MAG: fatty acid desaturase [Planctomycetia bacterium]|nr:fatty acid desaturase [Planctomycetia bacterium]